MTKLELVNMLHSECYSAAADRILDGEDPRRVLNDERPFTSRYGDDYGRQCILVFQAIARGDTVVT